MIKILLTLGDQTIEGTLRGLISASNTDILLLGNKKSSILLSFADADIKTISIEHTGEVTSFGGNTSNKSIVTVLEKKTNTKIKTEIYTPRSRQEAYTIITSICTKYTGSKPTINTENFSNIKDGLQYRIENNDNTPTITKEVPVYTEAGNGLYTNKHHNYRNSKPKKIIDEGIVEFMNKVLEGHTYKRNHQEQGYFEQLAD